VQQGTLRFTYHLNNLKRIFDSAGNLIVEQGANGNETAFVDTPRNALSRELRPMAAVTNYRYDLGVTQYRDDKANNLVAQQDAKLATTRFAFDALNRSVAIHVVANIS
jgi:YD repeat-containing protein